MWRNTVAIHNILKKKTTKLNFQPAPYEKNKINKKKFEKKTQKNWKKKKKTILEKTNEKKWEKNMWGKLKLNSQPAQY